MTLEDAMKCDEIPVNEALAEIRKHGFDAFVVSDRIEAHEPFTARDGSTYVDVHAFPIDAQGHVHGGRILKWLGY